MEFIKWYRVSENILEGLIPHLADNEIVSFVSNNRWLVIPTEYEVNRKDSINRPDPNMFINLSRERRIGLGIVCNTLASIERMRNILHEFHSFEKGELVKRLSELDDGFMTSVERKNREYYYNQTPAYEVDLEIPLNQIDSSSISDIFKRVDQILDEGRLEKKQRGIHWLPILPHLNLAITWMELNEEIFRAKLEQLKPIYEIVLRIRTNKEIRDEETKRERERIIEKQREFAKFVEELKRKDVSGEEYRKLVSEWNKNTPNSLLINQKKRGYEILEKSSCP